MPLGSQINKLFRKAGFQVHRAKPVPSSFRPVPLEERKKQALVVEFIGPSGVGKSTLFRKLLDRRSRLNWATTGEWLRAHGLTSGVRRLNEREQRLLKLKFGNVAAQQLDISDKVWLVSFFEGNLKEDQAIRKIGIYDCVVREDGIFHNFAEEIDVLRATDEAELEGWLQGRAFVFLRADDDVMVERLRARDAEGETRPQHTKVSDAERISGSRRIMDLNEALAASIDKNGGRLIRCDLGGDPESCCEKVEAALGEWMSQWDASSGRWLHYLNRNNQ
jgi:adenylate kinase family enzyme